MKFSNLLLVMTVLQISIVIKSLAQTMHWDERYAETVFEDDFNGTIDEKWNVVKAFKRDIGILIDSSATVKINASNLELTMINCPNCETTFNGITYYGDYAGGEIMSKDAFQYGIFECRAKYARNLGSWPAFWLLGGDGIHCPPGGYGNEIDIAEVKCQTYMPKMGHVIHRYYPPVDCNESNSQVKDLEIYNFQLNNVYCNYKCIWTPNKISYYINNNLMHEVLNTGQEWYPELELQIYLSQQIITASDMLGHFSITTPQTTYFDKVSVKRFFPTPEIICPPVICSSGIASFGVESEAENISWQLSPSNLFSTTNGSGLTANITTLSGASGLGTITFSFEMPSGEEFTAQKTFWVGPPSSAQFDMRNVDFYGYNYLYEGTTNQLIANDYATQPAITEWEWDYGGWYHWEVTSTKYISFVDVPSFSYRDISVRAKNQCPGASNWYTERFYPYEGFFLVFSPNPSTGETVLSIESASTEKAFDETTEWELEVYSETQLLKEKKTRLKGKNTTIQTAGWQDGIYIVRVKYKEEVLTGKLVVKKM